PYHHVLKGQMRKTRVISFQHKTKVNLALSTSRLGLLLSLLSCQSAHNAQVHQDGFQGNRHVNHAVMMVNRGGAAAVIIQNNVDGGAAHVPDANAYEEIPAHGLLPDPVVHNAPQAAAVNQPA
ncbi:hypothetical protein BaRGS_00013323, partial [Batillaria attramentaria]